MLSVSDIISGVTRPMTLDALFSIRKCISDIPSNSLLDQGTSAKSSSKLKWKDPWKYVEPKD